VRERGSTPSPYLRITDVPALMLDTQYRMHPLISEFPCTEFYGATLRDGTVSETGVVLSQLKPPRSRLLDEKSAADGSHPAMLFIDHDNPEEKRDRSHLNQQESKIVARIIEDLLLKNADLKGKDIGVIAPYVAQIRLLEKTLRYDPEWADHFIRVLGEQRAKEILDIEVKTVDGFEGREKEVIIFSTVRNNPFGEIGFLADRRRMNVALTRAKRGLFVLGSIRTLGGSAQKVQNARRGASLQDDTGTTVWNRTGRETWNRFMQFVVKKGLYHELEVPTVYRNPEELQLFFEASKTSIGGYTFLSDTRMQSWRQ
jgi:superfamily I DNA and/or RNA helicase